MERCEQSEGDVLRDPALVLLRLPIEFERPHGFERGKDGVDDFEVDVVAGVAPYEHEDEEIRADDG